MSDQNKKDNENSKFTIDDNVDSMLNIIKKRNTSASENESSYASSSSNSSTSLNEKENTGVSKAETDTGTGVNSASSSLVPPHSEKQIADKNLQNESANAELQATHGSSAAHGHKADSFPAFSHNDGGKAHVVSFDDIDPENARLRRSKQMKKNVENGANAAVGFIKTIIYVAAVVLVSIFLAVTIINAANDIYAFKKPDISAVITIPENADIDEVAKILKENGVIENPFIFKIYAKREFKNSPYYNGEFKAGEHTIVFKNESDNKEVTGGGNFTTDYVQLSKSEDDSGKPLNYDRIISLLAVSTYKKRDTVRITIPEGYTVDEIIDLLVSNGVGEKQKYIDAVQNHDYEYRFIKEIPENKDRKYRLEGYLFPDTYDFFTDESEISVINKMLVNFEAKFEEVYYERAEELGMSVDELIILASILEKEAKYAADLPLMSSVFHNRINAGIMLGSDATVMYLLPERKTALTSEDLAIDNPYNTRKYRGIPPGAISNPGLEAINAAFYPSKTNYYYFLTPTNGETVYSRTEAEHNAARAKARSEGTLAE